MLNKTQIQNTLDRIEKLYNKHIYDYLGTYFAKLAIIEACGWIEESIDDIVLDCADKHLVYAENIIAIQRDVHDTSSFKYDPNLKHLLEHLFGLIGIERLGKAYDNPTDTDFKDKLSEVFRIILPVDFDTGCAYDPTSTQTLIKLFGKIYVESLEKCYNPTKFAAMDSALARLKHTRDTQAHSYLKGTLPSVDAPSFTKGKFREAYDGLKDIEACIRRFTAKWNAIVI